MLKEVAEDFRRILGLQADEQIPANLASMYCDYRYRKDVCSAGGVSASELILLTIIAGCDRKEPPKSVKPKEPKNDKRSLITGDRVKTLVDGQSAAGIFIEKCGGKKTGMARVKIDGEKANFHEVLFSDTEITE